MRHRIAKQALECPHCRTTQVCEIERDEDGAYCEIETEPCHADGCTVRLCRSCPQSECVSCGLAHCEDHSIVAAAGPTCPLCFQKAVDEGMTASELMTGDPGGAGMPEGMRQPEDDGMDGRDDDVEGQDSYTLGAERCPPRE